ncbi:uncharacterized protein LOC114439388 isoform X1 [Parambassis ranga]|uniref:Uncharacterized protein LOC114439388 isoform X1 n=1 Tax=Parambassis ranga TaxID=210632 RepID=A0A6P7ITV9_9TELE|nr:uncharacterized protein LOC114439388 isoform X1 [Parambassis ranga]
MHLKSVKYRSCGARTLTTTSHERATPTCCFCKKTGHALQKCRVFLEKAVSDRVKFIQGERLCFKCLKPGHRSKSCSKRNVCDKCHKQHPTCLHEDRVKEENPKCEQNTNEQGTNQGLNQVQVTGTTTATANRVIRHQGNTQTAAIVPIWLSSLAQPAQEVLVYALLDSQSDTTLILSEVAESLETNKEQVKLRLSTMTSKTMVVCSQKLSDIQVRGFYSSKRIALPPVYACEFIPANRTHIPTNETAKVWPHLEHLQEEIAPLQDCEVGLLIGYNCSQALLPREIISGKEDEPYVQRSDLGWSIVGPSSPYVDYGDAVGISHHIIVREVCQSQKRSTLR